MPIPFSKYHGLGNDYIVIDPSEVRAKLTAERIQRICHRNFGVGSDGILLGPAQGDNCDVGLQIFNPDGSEAEKSGNGIRIFSRYLWDQKRITEAPFTIKTLGGPVTSQILEDGKQVSADMGKVSFHSRDIPVTGPSREVLNEALAVEKDNLCFCAATIGNPHCVILKEAVSAEETHRLGPAIETDARFPNRTNVQFLKIMDRTNIRIEIWERGAGYTLASGSSASAAAAVAHRLDKCDSNIAVHMPGGTIDIVISQGYSIQMTGPVTKICDGFIDDEVFEH